MNVKVDKPSSKASEDDLIYCPICFDVFDNPRSMPCLHTFCYKCLDMLCKNTSSEGDSIECPICRRVCEIPSEGVAGFASNFFIQRMVDGCASQKVVDFCEVCDDSKRTVAASKYCLDCRLRLCEKCNRLHERMGRGNHRIRVNGTELERELVQLISWYCVDHVEELHAFYCFNCSCNVCVSCVDEKHQEHKLQKIDTVASSFISQISADVVAVKKRLDEAVQRSQCQKSALKDFCDRISAVANEVDKHCRAIKSYFETVIDDQKQKTLQELHLIEQHTLKQFQELDEHASVSFVCMKSFINYSEELRSKGQSCDITRAGNSIHARASEILQEYPLTPVYNGPKIEFKAEEFLGSLGKNGRVGYLMKTENMDSCESMMNTVRHMKSIIRQPSAARTTRRNKDAGATSRSTPSFLTRLQQLYQPMTEKLSAKPVAAVLYQSDLLSLADLQEVQNSPTPVKAAEHLLNRLLNSCSAASYDCFLRALKAQNQEHIFLWLTYEDYNIDSTHSELIRRKYTYLLEHLNPQASGLIALLFQEKVIDLGEKDFLETGEGATCQAERLLAVLSRKSKKQFEQFYVALDKTGHDHIANELRRCHQSVDKPSDLVNRDRSVSAFTHSPQPSDLSMTPSTGPVQSAEDVNSSTLLTATAVVNTTPFKFSISGSRPTTAAKRTSVSSVMHVIAAREDRKGYVGGLTVLSTELYVARFAPKGLIEVYNAANFTFKRNRRVKELEGGEVHGLTSCETNHCLYVIYQSGGEFIVKVEVTGNNKVAKWKIKDYYRPRGLSVNSEHNLMVACSGSRKLIEFTSRGEVVREILLKDDVVNPHHVIQLNSSQFLVSHGFGDSLRRVCVVDANGRVLFSYGKTRRSGSGNSNVPQRLAVDKHGFIYVAEMESDKIVVLDSTLKWSRDVKLDDNGVKGPYSLFLDEQRHVLLVGEWNGDDSRVAIVKL